MQLYEFDCATYVRTKPADDISASLLCGDESRRVIGLSGFQDAWLLRRLHRDPYWRPGAGLRPAGDMLVVDVDCHAGADIAPLGDDRVVSVAAKALPLMSDFHRVVVTSGDVKTLKALVADRLMKFEIGVARSADRVEPDRCAGRAKNHCLKRLFRFRAAWPLGVSDAEIIVAGHVVNRNPAKLWPVWNLAGIEYFEAGIGHHAGAGGATDSWSYRCHGCWIGSDFLSCNRRRGAVCQSKCDKRGHAACADRTENPFRFRKVKRPGHKRAMVKDIAIRLLLVEAPRVSGGSNS